MNIELEGLWNKNFNLDELNFLGENILIEVLPSVKTTIPDNINLICGTFENLKPNKKVKLPLWMAVKLRQKSKCKIYPPFWLQIDFLQEHIKMERENTEKLIELPYFFYEVAHILCHKAHQDITNLDEVKNMCADIKSVRNEKINKILSKIKDDKYYFNINNICSRELELIRPLVVDVLNASYEFNSISS